ncbi:MAG: 3-phosphoshikimate 1-carboxyvinyltransferase, partial [Candidatus Binatia bacterium]
MIEDRVTVEPARGPLGGEVSVPGDKSVGHRAVIFNAAAEGEAIVSGLSSGRDICSTVGAMRSLGAELVDEGAGVLRIRGRGLAFDCPAGRLDCGNSGTTMRLLAGLLSGQAFACELSGDDSLSGRPMGRVADPLALMGARVKTTAGHAPLRIDGRSLAGAKVDITVPSAQLKTALLLAALQARGRSKITEPALSRDHTERLLSGMGIEIGREIGGRRWSGARIGKIGPLDGLPPGPSTVEIQGPAVPVAKDLHVHGDPSSAAFLAVAACIVPGSEITIRDLYINPTRSGFARVLVRMGADLRFSRTGESAGEAVGDLTVRGTGRLRGVEIGGEEMPATIDEIPVLAVAAACAEGTTLIRGAAELRVKESDRVAGITAMLGALGARTEQGEDGLSILGGRLKGGALIETQGDHRMVMAAAIAAL